MPCMVQVNSLNPEIQFMEHGRTSHHMKLARSTNTFSAFIFFSLIMLKFCFSRQDRMSLMRRKPGTNELTTKVRGGLIVPVGCCVVQPAEQQQVYSCGMTNDLDALLKCAQQRGLMCDYVVCICGLPHWTGESSSPVTG